MKLKLHKLENLYLNMKLITKSYQSLVIYCKLKFLYRKENQKKYSALKKNRNLINKLYCKKKN